MTAAEEYSIISRVASRTRSGGRRDPAQGRTSRKSGQPSRRDPWPCRAGTTTLPPHPGRSDSQGVKRWRPYRTSAACKELLADLERTVPLDGAARACCCQARPVVTVVMPPTASRPHPVDLLLCGHHFRVSRAALYAAGAAVYDETGLLIMAGARDAGVPGPKAGRLVRTAPGNQA